MGVLHSPARPRLRRWPAGWIEGEREEAEMSDLVEQLRGERNIARIDLANMEMRLRHRDAEIAELRTDLTTAEAALESLQNKWASRPLSVGDTAALERENEALRAELARLADAGAGYSQQTVDAITKEREELRTERDRLRERLTRWIPVSERWPPVHEHVWCLNRCGRQFEGAPCYGMHAPFFTLPHGDGNSSNTVPAWIDVTHWRPLPEVPRWKEQQP